MDLIIESSLPVVALGLYQEGQKIWEEVHPGGRGEQLDKLLDKALLESHRSIDDVHRVMITRGPGSFTGLRAGIAFALGLCFSGKRKLYAPTTFAAVVGVDLEPGTLIVIPAKPNLVYVGYTILSMLGTQSQVSWAQTLLDHQQLDDLVEKSAFKKMLTWGTQWSHDLSRDLSKDFTLNSYSASFTGLEPIAPTQVHPNYIQAPYAKVSAKSLSNALIK